MLTRVGRIWPALSRVACTCHIRTEVSLGLRSISVVVMHIIRSPRRRSRRHRRRSRMHIDRGPRLGRSPSKRHFAPIMSHVHAALPLSFWRLQLVLAPHLDPFPDEGETEGRQQKGPEEREAPPIQRSCLCLRPAQPDFWTLCVCVCVRVCAWMCMCLSLKRITHRAPLSARVAHHHGSPVTLHRHTHTRRHTRT